MATPDQEAGLGPEVVSEDGVEQHDGDVWDHGGSGHFGSPPHLHLIPCWEVGLIGRLVFDSLLILTGLVTQSIQGFLCR